MDNDWKKRLGVVYSTNENFDFDYSETEKTETLAPNQQHLIVRLDKKNRKGKAVTLIDGFVGTEEDLKALGKLLKSKCGVGGSADENQILLQGDHREKVLKILMDAGYKTKRSGG